MKRASTYVNNMLQIFSTLYIYIPGNFCRTLKCSYRPTLHEQTQWEGAHCWVLEHPEITAKSEDHSIQKSQHSEMVACTTHNLHSPCKHPSGIHTRVSEQAHPQNIGIGKTHRDEPYSRSLHLSQPDSLNQIFQLWDRETQVFCDISPRDLWPRIYCACSKFTQISGPEYVPFCLSQQGSTLINIFHL